MAALKLCSDHHKVEPQNKMPRENKIFILFTAFVVAMFAAASVSAEIIPGFGGSSDAPITVNAEELAIDRKVGQAIFSGQVEARQSGQRLTARHMNVIYDPEKADIQFLYASGDVQFIGRPQSDATTPSARGELAEYNVATKKLILSGKVVLERGEHIIKGQSLVIDLITGQSLMDSTQKGLPGRVRGLFKRTKKPKNE